MGSHEFLPEDITVSGVNSDHLKSSTTWNYEVRSIGGHALSVRGQLNSTDAIADATFTDTETRVPYMHLSEIHVEGDDLDTVPGACKALAKALTRQIDIGRIPATYQLPLPLSGPQS